MRSRSRLTRRGFVRTVGAGAAVAAAAGVATAQQPTFDGFLSNTDNYDGVVDRTGRSAVTVDVGASGNGGSFAFGPAAVRVDPGTTVTWRWTGKGAGHNVRAVEGADFDSGTAVTEEGTTFEHRFEAAGVVKYVCDPHEPLGMKGVVVVGDADRGGGTPAATTAAPGGGQSREADLVAGFTGDELVGVGASGALGLVVLGMGYLTWLGTRQDAGGPEE